MPVAMQQKLCLQFGLTIRHLRDKHYWTQEILAEKADLNRSFIGELERGKAIPSLLTMDKLADAFGISLTQLMNHCEQTRQKNTASQHDLTSIAC